MSNSKNHSPFQHFYTNLSSFKAVLIISIIGIIVYGNTFFNGFVWDDLSVILSNPDIKNFNIAHILNGKTYTNSIFYRPIQDTYNSLLYSLFKQQSFFYHFLQVSIHIILTILLFFLYRNLLNISFSKDKSNKNLQSFSSSHYEETQSNLNWSIDILALFLSLIFLVHPINVESVAYFAASQSPLFMLFGIVALLIGMNEKISVKNLVIVSTLLLLSLFTKEIGILFLLITVCFQFLFKMRSLVKYIIVALIVISIYSFFRFIIAGIFLGNTHMVTVLKIPPAIENLPLTERLVNVPAIIFYYLQTLFFPAHLVIDQQWIVTSVTGKLFYIPLLLDGIFFIVLCLLGVYIYTNRNNWFKLYAFFFIWFTSGLLILTQIIPLEMTVADRWFYFPLVGFLGMVGVSLQAILFTPDKHYVFKANYKANLMIIISGCLLILLLSVRTIVRNTNYQNEIILFSHDAKLQDNPGLEEALAGDYAQVGNTQLAIYHVQRSVNLHPYTNNLYELGYLYASAGNLQKAQEYLSKSLTFSETYYAANGQKYRTKESNLNTYKNLVRILIYSENYDACERISSQGLIYYSNSSQLWIELLICQIKLHHWKDALLTAKKANTIAPSDSINILYSGAQHKIEMPTSVIPTILKNINDIN